MDSGAPSLVLNLSTLREPVRRALGGGAAEVKTWECHSIHRAFNQVTGGLFRIDGQAVEHREVFSWSIVLKIVRNTVHLGQATDDPPGVNYWKREPLLYQSGLLDYLPAGIAAPRCYGVDDPDAETAWIWLEDVADASEARWTQDHYVAAAQRLGAFNGAYLATGSLPNEPFLSRGQRWHNAAAWSTLFPHLSVARNLPVVRQTWPESLHSRVHRIEEDRDALHQALDRLPITFCHLDAFRRNLLVRRRADGGDDLVGVDWAFSGLGPVGADLAPLVGAGLALGQFEPDQLADLDSAAFAAYVDGLRGAGWDGDPRLARLGFTASAPLRYAMYPRWARAVDDQGNPVERAGDRPIQEVLERGALIISLLCDLADEARNLILDVRTRV